MSPEARKRVPKPPGAPPKYDDALAARIAQAVAAGRGVRAACRDAGIGRSTFYQWVRARPAFRDLVAAANADREARGVAAAEALRAETVAASAARNRARARRAGWDRA